jgi:ABC-type multidrug transport system fused ATPase/permease subunit
VSVRRTLTRVLKLGAPDRVGFVWVALLVSLGTLAGLFEPWIYRAIVDDVAGVFVQPMAVRVLERDLSQFELRFEHITHSGTRIIRSPLRRVSRAESGPRPLRPRTTHEAMNTVIASAVLLVLVRLVSELCSARGDNRVAVLSNRIETNFILGTFRHVLRLPISFFSRRPSGAIARQIDQSDHVAPVFIAFAQEVWPNLFRLVVIFGVLLSMNLELALVALLAVPAYAFVSWRLSRMLETQLEQYYGLWDEVSGRIQETLGGIKTVMGFGAAQHEYDRLAAASNRALTAYVARNNMQNRYGVLQEMIIATAKAGTLLLGGIKALQHQLTPGDIVLFVSYLDQLYYPVQNLTDLYAGLQENASSVQRAEKLIDTPEAPGEDLPPLAPGPGAIEFRDVHFGYRANRPVLDGVSFRIEAGQHVGLIGPSGAGKTTLTDLLNGLYQPQSGEILIDGQPIAGVSTSSVRAAVRGVAVDGTLFRMSIADNVRYGSFDASDDAVREAAQRAGLAPLLDRLPEGLATAIGERGAELSAGERQRVLIARAFLSRPRVIVLDEATANLDFRTEASVKEALREISHGRTSLIVAHRKTMLTEVDRVLVLRGGHIEQDGAPAELVRQPGYFRDLMAPDEAPAGS